MPERLSSDLDMAVHPGDIRALPLVFSALRKEGYTPVQVFNYLVGAYYFVFTWFEGCVVNSVAVDIIVKQRRGGLTAPSVASIISGRRRHGIFWTPGPESEFVYLLAKKTWKRTAPPKQASRLKALIEQLGRPAAERLASQVFLGTKNVRVIEACANGSVHTMLASTYAQTWKTSVVRNPFRAAAYVLSEGMRCFRRWRQPTGLFVVIMGPDGAGKSTLIQQLVQVLDRTFRRVRVFHWRPSLLWRRSGTGDITQPHSRPRHSAWFSVARLCAHVLDYWVGYCIVILPLLARSGLVVFDRYFDDVLIDPQRYRYGGPFWVAGFLRRLVPRPDLVLILDAPEEVVLSRKQEVAPDELRRQRKMYLGHGNGTTETRVINAAGSVSHVTSEAARAIIEFLAKRFENRCANW
ncbi:MAG: hypothetical protein ACR2JB_13075 [Bryobacteraceae bacterium]